MIEQQNVSPRRSRVDITELAVLGEQFPLRLMQLGFRLFQVVDVYERDQVRYVLPPLCEVAAGSFLMGSDRQRDPQMSDDEMKQSPRYVPAFRIGAYPVTVAEFACAVEAGAIKEPSRGSNFTWQTQQQRPDHPVVCITWHQARAYATWLTKLTCQHWRLPTENEWEKAARGTDGRIYPWGNQWDMRKANAGESNINTTTPIGSYADQGDASPYGVHDMSGNVWEWTGSRYLPFSTVQTEDDADTATDRVLRGGSWNLYARDARVAYGIRGRVGTSENTSGMRLVLSARGGR